MERLSSSNADQSRVSAVHRVAIATAMILLHSVSSSANGKGAASYTDEPCTKGEKWVFSSAIPTDLQKEMTAAVFKERSPTQSFAEAFHWRRVIEADEPRALTEYWISRSMYDAGLYHSAVSGFNAILQRQTSSQNAGIQAATMGCLAKIYEKYPSMNDSLVEVDYQKIIESIPKNASEQVWVFALQQYLLEPNQKTLVPLSGSGGLDVFAQAVLDVKQLKYSAAIKGFQKTLDLIDKGALASKVLSKYKDKVYLLMARAQYATGQYAQASQSLQKVSKQSNDLAAAVTEMSWAQLMNGDLKDAIGGAYSLTVGALSSAFTPEASMVMAMAMNELCQYPHSLDAIQTFKKSYVSSFQWLENWSQNYADKLSLYDLMIDALKKKKTDLPDKVLTEWLKTPVFIANQREINLIIDENTSSKKIIQMASSEIKKEGELITLKAQDLMNQIKTFRSRQTTYQVGIESLPRPLQEEITDFRDRITHYRRYRAAAAPWKKITTHAASVAAAKRNKLIAQIETTLRSHSRRMLTQIQEIAENNQLIEVEIYNGASQDIIWQNAHPDYKEKAAQLEKKADRGPASKSLDWGRTISNSEGQVEVWEDEIGSFQANLFDNCSNKEKYLAIGREE